MAELGCLVNLAGAGGAADFVVWFASVVLLCMRWGGGGDRRLGGVRGCDAALRPSLVKTHFWGLRGGGWFRRLYGGGALCIGGLGIVVVWLGVNAPYGVSFDFVDSGRPFFGGAVS